MTQEPNWIEWTGGERPVEPAVPEIPCEGSSLPSEQPREQLPESDNPRSETAGDDDDVDPFPDWRERESFAHRAAMKIRPDSAGDAEYWRIRAEVRTAIDEHSPAPPALPPGSIASAFPSEAVDSLRKSLETGKSRGGLSFPIFLDDLDEVLAWIDRFVPRSLPNCELSIGSVGELIIEEPDLVVDLIRCNGETFVKEVPTIATVSLDISIEAILRDVCELPDRSSPDDWPEAMLVTGEELDMIIRRAFEVDDDHNPDGFQHCSPEMSQTIAEAVANDPRHKWGCPACGYSLGHPGSSTSCTCPGCDAELFVETGPLGPIRLHQGTLAEPGVAGEAAARAAGKKGPFLHRSAPSYRLPEASVDDQRRKPIEETIDEAIDRVRVTRETADDQRRRKDGPGKGVEA